MLVRFEKVEPNYDHPVASEYTNWSRTHSSSTTPRVWFGYGEGVWILHIWLLLEESINEFYEIESIYLCFLDLWSMKPYSSILEGVTLELNAERSYELHFWGFVCLHESLMDFSVYLFLPFFHSVSACLELNYAEFIRFFVIKYEVNICDPHSLWRRWKLGRQKVWEISFVPTFHEFKSVWRNDQWENLGIVRQNQVYPRVFDYWLPLFSWALEMISQELLSRLQDHHLLSWMLQWLHSLSHTLAHRYELIMRSSELFMLALRGP